jgi:uridine kinase
MKKIILVSGKLQSGKNTFADCLIESLIENTKETKIKQDSFALPVKTGSKADFKLLIDYLNNSVTFLKNRLNKSILYKLFFKKKVDKLLEQLFVTNEENWFENKNSITRIILQIYGNEIFRERVDKLHWVKMFLDRFEHDYSDYTIITDTRYANEIDYIKRKAKRDKNFEVVTVRIDRDIDRSNPVNGHTSETALDNYKKFDYFIENNTGNTISQLKKDADAIVKSIIG